MEDKPTNWLLWGMPWMIVYGSVAIVVIAFIFEISLIMENIVPMFVCSLLLFLVAEYRWQKWSTEEK